MEAIESIIIALIFNGADLLTGIISAIKNGDIKSSKLRDGMFKKIGFISCYFMAWLIDTYGCLVGFTFTVKILPLVLLYTCTTEIVSIIENIHRINPDLLPEKLLKLFQLSNEEEK